MKLYTMWNWLKNSSTEGSAPPEHPYYGAKVSLNEQKVVLHRNNGDNQEIDKQHIICIRARSIHPEKEDEYWVDIAVDSGTNMSITSLADGFADLEQWMLSLDGFDRAAYKSDQKNTSADDFVLWKAPVTKNASLVTNDESTSFEKLSKGLLLEKRDTMIPWATFAELANVSGVERSTVSLPNPDYTKYVYTLHDVQILNGLQVETLRAQTPSWAAPNQFNDDWPVTGYTASATLGESAEDDFERLKDHISQFWGKPNYENDYPSSQEACWNCGDNTIELSISTLPDSDIYRPGCRITVSHEPDVDRFYSSDYQQQLQLHDQLHYRILDINTDINHSYITEKRAWYTPFCFKTQMQSGSCFLIWRDDKYHKIGFGNGRYCQIYDKNDWSKLTLVNRYWRDNPSECSLYINLKHTIGPNRHIGTFKTNDVQQWQQIKQSTAEIAQKPLVATVDHQYY